jgi:hypothetical protein
MENSPKNLNIKNMITGMLKRLSGLLPKKKSAMEMKDSAIIKVMSGELRNHVGSSEMWDAFRAASRLNKEKEFGLSDENLLELLSLAATVSVSPAQDRLVGGPGEVQSFIANEITSIRKRIAR